MAQRVKFAPGDKIEGIPVKALRDLLRWMDTRLIQPEYLVERASAHGYVGDNTVTLLERDGYIHRVPYRERWDWQATAKGVDLAALRFHRRIPRARAEEQLVALLERVKQVNTNPIWPYFIGRVLLFGSMLSGQPEVGDVDVAVELVPCEEDQACQRKCEQQFIQLAVADGRNFCNILGELFWPSNSILLFLKARSPVIDMNDARTVIARGFPSQVVYEMTPRSE